MMAWAKLGLKGFNAGGGVPGQSDVPVAWPAENVLFSAPLMKAPLSPSLAVHFIKEASLL